MKKLVNIAKTVSYFIYPPNDIVDFEPTIGWFSNKYNSAGWSVVPLSNVERLWLSNNNVKTDDIENVFRAVSEKGGIITTSLVKFDLVKGTYSFLDNQILENENKIVFERKERFRSFKVENSDFAKSEFGVS